MGKLNNRGFGMSTMLIFIGIFIIVLIAVMVLAYNNGVEKDSPVKAVEKKMVCSSHHLLKKRRNNKEYEKSCN